MLQDLCRLVVAFLFLCFTYAGAAAQQGNMIRGKVRSPSSTNTPLVTVELLTGTGSLINQTAANNEGDFFFTGLLDSSYIVVISAPDFDEVAEHVEFSNKAGADRPGETRTIEITLSPRNRARGARPAATFVQDVPKAARENLDRAAKLLRDGQTEPAIALLHDALKIFPSYFDAHFALANELFKKNQLSEAIAELEQARQINPKEGRVYQLFGSVLMQQKKYALAAAVFAEASRLEPLDPQSQLRRGLALIEQASSISPTQSKDAAADRASALTDAENSLLKAYELSSKKLTSVLLQLARVYEKQGKPSLAADVLERYLRETPNANNQSEIRGAIQKLRTPAGRP